MEGRLPPDPTRRGGPRAAYPPDVDVAVIGATGDVGRQVCTQLVERALLPATSRLQLVGRVDGDSADAVHGLRADLIGSQSTGSTPAPVPPPGTSTK